MSSTALINEPKIYRKKVIVEIDFGGDICDSDFIDLITEVRNLAKKIENEKSHYYAWAYQLANIMEGK